MVYDFLNSVIISVKKSKYVKYWFQAFRKKGLLKGFLLQDLWFNMIISQAVLLFFFFIISIDI